VGRAAADAGKQAGVLLWSADDVPAYRDVGYRLICLGSDGGHVVAGARAAATTLRAKLAG